MSVRRSAWLWGAWGATPLTLAIGWWFADREALFVAHARISVPDTIAEGSGPRMVPTIEEALLSPEALAAAADRMRRDGTPLPLASPLDSEIEHLINHLDAVRERHGDHDEFELTYLTPEPATAVVILTAVVESGLKALREMAPHAEDPAAEGRERERERVAQSLEKKRQAASSLDERIAEADRSDSRGDLTAEGMRLLTSALDAARVRRAETEDHLADARARFRSGASAAQVIAGLPEGTLGNSARELAGADETRGLLRRKTAALKELSRVYGRNHPRIVELRSDIDELRRRLATILVSPSKPLNPLAENGIAPADVLEADLPAVATVLLEILDEQQLQASALEQDLDRRLSAAVAAAERRKGLETQRETAKYELGLLQEEHDRLAREVTEARREADLHRANIVEPPALSPDPIVPSPAANLLWAGMAGLVASTLCWRKHRDTVRVAQAAPPAPAVEERSRKKPDNLARLRRLRRAA